MRRLLGVIGAIFAGSQVGYAQCPSLEGIARDTPIVTIGLPAKQSPAKVGSPVWIEVTMTNPFDHEISFWKNTKSNSQPIEVTDQAGRSLTDKRPGYRHGKFDPALLDPKNERDAQLIESGELIRMLSGSVVCITLKPGEKFVDRVDVATMYEMGAPGTYRITLGGSGPAKAGNVKPRSVDVRVTKE